jgi:glycosyltransferase involved in cell wall biosynthesis
MVSIIVPGLNEARTVKEVLHELALLDFQGLGLGKEILFVDGGSTDGTLELARSEPDVKVYRLDRPGRRGQALRMGIERASGDVIAFFPSDGEYDPRDLVPVVMGIVKNEFQVVFGSRNIKLKNLTRRIKLMYGGNWTGYLVSKYGGLLLGVLTLLLYNRSLSDVFSTVKAFDARLLRSLDLKSKGVDLETEVIAKLGRRGTFILEVPVKFRPRRKEEGKKTTLTDGLRALFVLIGHRFRRHENAVDHHPGV